MLHIGIVGLGGIGNNHARCYTENKHAKVIAVCDVIKEKADAAAARYGARAFYSVKQMLKSGFRLDGSGCVGGGGRSVRCPVGAGWCRCAGVGNGAGGVGVRGEIKSGGRDGNGKW